MTMYFACALLILLAPQGGPSPPPIQHLDCVRAASAVVVDGKAEERAWKEATPVTDFRLSPA